MNDFFEFEGFNDDLLLKIENSEFIGNEIEDESEFIGVGAIVSAGAGAVSKVAEASAKKKEAEMKITEIGGKRSAQLLACEKSKENNFLLDRKKTRNRIKDCKDKVNARMDEEEKEQKEIVKRMTSLEEGKASADLEKSKADTDEKKSSKKLYVIGGIVGLTLILGTIILIRLRRK